MSSSSSTRSSRRGGVFSLAVAESRPGYLSFEASGKDAANVFANEAGGHRWQRVPPTEKRGRVHTSTVTVAVLPQPTEVEVSIPDSEVEVKTTRAGGPGGQNRQKNDTAVILTHRPTGITVRCENERSQWQNRQLAFAVLRARLWERERAKVAGDRADLRRRQVGSGMRGDKRRTIRTQDGVVTDHVLGKRWELKRYLRGDW
jgi:peptide chain release factor 1